MKNIKIMVLSGVIFLAIIVVSIITFNDRDISTNLNRNDAFKFKEEYESLNNMVRESDGEIYNSISIDEDNPIVYIDVLDALEVLNSEKAIIYIGANWCPWCRNAVPVILDVAKDLDIDTIYYLNLDEDKSNFKIENGELVEINHGSDEYYKLLDALNDYLRDYILTDKDGNKYDTGEKRIYMPYVLTIKNGNVASEHLSTVSLDKEQTKYDSLTEAQYKELYDIYYKMFDELYNNSKTCSSKEECS